MNNLYTILRLCRTSICPRLRRSNHKSQKKVICAEKKSLINFDCKVALITGGSDGIGLAVAHDLLTENVKNVALVGIDCKRGRESVSSLNRTYGKNKAIFINCDVQSKVQVIDCYCKVVKEFGKLDIVINSAGVFDGANWEKEIMTNLVGTIHNMLEAYKLMSKEESGSGGVVLNFSGLPAVKPLYPAPTLTAACHAINGLSRCFGHESVFKSTGIRVVTLCPGITKTNFIKDAEKRALSEKMANHIHTMMQKIKRQKADACAQSAIHVLKYGHSGSVWVVEGSKLYSLKIPHWKKYRTLESQLI